MLRYGSLLVATIALLAWVALGSACGSEGKGDTETPNGDVDNGNGNGEANGNGNGEWGEWSPEECHEVGCPTANYHVQYCGSCERDEDGLWPWQNPHCTGPCDDYPDGFYHGMQPITAGQGKCVRDCYFDGDSGAGNDDCEWNHACDPLEPRPENCPHDPDIECVHTQSEMCHEVCMPVVPNGCDCFGCCELPVDDEGNTEWRFIGTQSDGVPTCTLDNVIDGCNPCTPSEDCVNECGRCQICLGKTELPPDCYGTYEEPDPDDPDYDPEDPGDRPIDCTDPDEWDPDYCQCPWYQQPCGLEGQDPCPPGYYCITGCCVQIG